VLKGWALKGEEALSALFLVLDDLGLPLARCRESVGLQRVLRYDGTCKLPVLSAASLAHPCSDYAGNLYANIWPTAISQVTATLQECFAWPVSAAVRSALLSRPSNLLQLLKPIDSAPYALLGTLGMASRLRPAAAAAANCTVLLPLAQVRPHLAHPRGGHVASVCLPCRRFRVFAITAR